MSGSCTNIERSQSCQPPLFIFSSLGVRSVHILAPVGFASRIVCSSGISGRSRLACRFTFQKQQETFSLRGHIGRELRRPFRASQFIRRGLCSRESLLSPSIYITCEKANDTDSKRSQESQSFQETFPKSFEWDTPWDVPWEIGTVVTVLVQWIVAYVVLGGLVVPFLGMKAGLRTDVPLEQATIVLLSYLAETVAGLYVLYANLKDYFPLQRLGMFKYEVFSDWWKTSIPGFIIAIPTVVFASFINAKIIGEEQVQLQEISEVLLGTGQDWGALALLTVTVSILAPVFEETLFRGFLLPSLTRYLPVWGSIGVSGFIFGLAHLSNEHVVPLTVFGCLLGFVYCRTRNLVSSIAIHAAWNSITVLLLLALQSMDVQSLP